MLSWFQRWANKSKLLILIGLMAVQISYPGCIASSIPKSLIDQAQSALTSLDNGDYESAWKIWDTLAADPLCPIRKHACHMAAQARFIWIKNLESLKQSSDGSRR